MENIVYRSIERVVGDALNFLDMSLDERRIYLKNRMIKFRVSGDVWVFLGLGNKLKGWSTKL